MGTRKLLNSFIEEMITASLFSPTHSVMDEYRELNDKCEDVIKKIKARKNDKTNGGEDG